MCNARPYMSTSVVKEKRREGYRSRKSGFASPMRSLVPFHVEPLRTFKPVKISRQLKTSQWHTHLAKSFGVASIVT